MDKLKIFDLNNIIIIYKIAFWKLFWKIAFGNLETTVLVWLDTNTGIFALVGWISREF